MRIETVTDKEIIMNNKIGVLINYREDTDILEEMRKAQSLELESCQLSIWNSEMLTPENAEKVREAMAETGFTVSAVWGGWHKPCAWNFTEGPKTIGLVPSKYRASRLEELKRASDFAEMIGVNKVITHVGFIPEDPNHPDFMGVVDALRELCEYLHAKGQYFLFETGQETPVTMLRTIEAIGLDNIGINFDTANLILYGKANTLDALDVFGKYVMQTHIKDGLYPTDGMRLGREVRFGDGKANFPAVVKRLFEFGYRGEFTIEREISGDDQIADIIIARDGLRQIMESL